MSYQFKTVKGKVLFLHIPKTGGTFVGEVLNTLCLIEKPFGLEDLCEAIHPDQRRINGKYTYVHGVRAFYPDDYHFVFAFVRDPLSWYESYFRFRHTYWKDFDIAGGEWDPTILLHEMAPTLFSDEEFNEWMEEVYRRQPGYVTRMYEWFLGPPGCECVNFVGRQERLHHDLSLILSKVGVEIKTRHIEGIPKANVSEKIPIEWDADLKSRVLAAEAPSIHRWYGEHFDVDI